MNRMLRVLWWMGLSAGLLTACGGGESEAPVGAVPRSVPDASATPRAARVAAEPSLSGQPVRKGEDPRVAVFRFYNTGTGSHFYTTDIGERENVYRTAPYMSPEGEAFYAAPAPTAGLSPVHRFFNTQTGVHFYTIDEDERDQVEANLPQFTYEGVAYHASLQPGPGLTPLYRFYLTQKGVHFYTASEEESLRVQATLSATHRYEGIGYHVMAAACDSPPCGAVGPNRPRVFIALHGNNELASNAALDAQWSFVRANAHGIWGNNAGISDALSAALIRKMNARTLITEFPVPGAGVAWWPLETFTNIQRLYPDIGLQPEGIAFYTSDPNRWNGRTVAQAEAIYTDPTAPVGHRYAGVYTGWQPQNFDPTNPRYLYGNVNALLAFRSSKGTFLECPLGACTSGRLGEAFRRAIRETHVRGRPFIWFASNARSTNPGWLQSFQQTYNAIAAEGLWRPEDVIAIVNYDGAYPKVPESVGGVAADTSTGLAFWALQQRLAATP